ncbi:MAG: DUF4350 domain-containing protein, partial [Gemmatimonadota bacterium]
MGSVRERALVGAAAVGMVVVALVAPADPAHDAWDLRHSSYHNSPYGVRGLYLALEELGIEVDRRLRPLDGPSLSGADALALFAPVEPPTPAELRAVGRWVEDGGTLLYVAASHDERTLDSLRLRLAPIGGAAGRDAGECGVRHRAANSVGRAAYPSADHAWTRGVERVKGFRCAFADWSVALLDDRAATLLATRAGEPVAVTFPRGRGTVLAWSDGGPLANRAIRGSGAAPVFARAAAAATRDGAGLAFDEYHQGYRGDGSVVRAAMSFLVREPAGHALVQLAVAGLLLLLLYGRRIGEPLPSPSPERRSPLEHVDALAAAYRRAGARVTA